jgi:hypothetical protein
MYVNTKETITKTYTSINPVGVLPIGTMNEFGNSKYSWNGLIDDVRIYNRALSAEEVSKLYRGEWVSDTGLVGHWEMDEGHGGQVRDKSGNGNHGTIYGATWGSSAPEWVDDTSGGALEFDGVKDFISINANNDLSLGVSYSFWAFIDNNQGHPWPRIFYQDGGSNDIEMAAGMMDSCRFRYAGNSIDSDTGYFIRNTRSHYLITYDLNNVYFFRDGALFDVKSFQNNGAISLLNAIGRGGMSLVGSISDVRIYNRALSEEEIQKIYEYGRTNKFYLSE